MTRWPWALMPTLLVLLLTGCGSTAPSTTAGRQAFAKAGCGGCHTLAAAGAAGTVGPNLDQLKPAAATVVAQVEHGGNGMPSFQSQLTGAQISSLGAYVEAATAHSTVIPAAAFKPDSTTLAACLGSPGFRCYEQAFGNVAFRQGPAPAIGLLQQKLGLLPTVQADCHRIAHAIGGAALAHFHGDVTQAMVGGSTICASGYYHGILERAFLGLPPSRLAGRAQSLCSSGAIASRPFLSFQCLHGLGHGLMIYTDYDLTGSLATCNQLATQFAQSSCSGGAFMENFSSSYGVRSHFLRDSDLTYPCDAVPDRDAYYCWIQVTERILPADGYNWPRTAAICRRTPARWVSACFESYGRDASGVAGKSAARALSLCQIAGDHANDCIYAVARDIVNTDAGPARAVAFCDRAGPSRNRCFDGIGTILAALHPAIPDRMAACAALRGARVNDCLLGAGVTRRAA